MRYATVCLESASHRVGRELTYSVPDELLDVIHVGSYVSVPLRKAATTGFVIALSTESPVPRVRPLAGLLQPQPVFGEKPLALAQWMSAYYHCDLADTVRCLVPPGIVQRSAKEYRLLEQPGEAEEEPLDGTHVQAIEALDQSGGVLTLSELRRITGHPRVTEVMRKLVERGLVEEVQRVAAPPARPSIERRMGLTSQGRLVLASGGSPRRLSEKQSLALHYLGQAAEPVSVRVLQRDTGVGASSLRSLVGRGLAERVEVETYRQPEIESWSPPPPPEKLTPEQSRALETIRRAVDQRISQPIVVFGVTSSGKTEVYLHAIEHTLKQNRQALVLVPEIALTAQTMGIFRGRFGDRVAILHSALSVGERYDEWRRLQSGKASIAVGPRSAVFAPCPNVGLIVMDEEHDTSYKQESSPRYHAREVAARRAALEGAALVLGSATPSVETYHRALTGTYRLCSLPHRIGQRAMPPVEIVDLRGTLTAGPRFVSDRLIECLRETVAADGQAILFLNRRGYSTFVICTACGHVERCRKCDVSLTFHREEGVLKCHHCYHLRKPPAVCPRCKSPVTGFRGVGTEQVEQEIGALLPEVPLFRMDRDTTGRKGSHGRILREFRDSRPAVLVGTQMVTKGLDFPGVTLVGVISADTSLNLPDFRAVERTFQLLTQVSGRAGRGEEPGRVVVQTYNPGHYAIVGASHHDFLEFFNEEIQFRQYPSYPPYAHLASIVAAADTSGTAEQRLNRVAEALREAVEAEGGQTDILGPAPCPLSRLQGKYRWHLLVRDRNRPRLHRLLNQTIDTWSSAQRRGIIVDVDPQSLL